MQIITLVLLLTCKGIRKFENFSVGSRNAANIWRLDSIFLSASGSLKCKNALFKSSWYISSSLNETIGRMSLTSAMHATGGYSSAVVYTRLEIPVQN